MPETPKPAQRVVWLCENDDVAATIAPGVEHLKAHGVRSIVETAGLLDVVKRALPDAAYRAAVIVAFNEQIGLPSTIAAIAEGPVLALPVLFGDETLSRGVSLEAALACDPAAPLVVLPPNQPESAAAFVLRLFSIAVGKVPPPRPQTTGQGLGERTPTPRFPRRPSSSRELPGIENLGAKSASGRSIPADDEAPLSPDTPRGAEFDENLARQLREIEALRKERGVRRELEADGSGPPSGTSASKPNGAAQGNSTLILAVDFAAPDHDLLEKLYYILADGGVIAFPTDTVFGLACDACNRDAVERIYELKGRDRSKPLVLMVDGIPMARSVVRRIPEAVEPLIEEHWPGALTLAFRRPKAMFRAITEGKTIALRIPESQFIGKLIARMARPLAVTSANLAGEEPPKHHDGVLASFEGRIEVVVKGECPKDAPPSTVLDVSGEPFRLLREGHVNRIELERLLPDGVLEPMTASS